MYRCSITMTRGTNKYAAQCLKFTRSNAGATSVNRWKRKRYSLLLPWSQKFFFWEAFFIHSRIWHVVLPLRNSMPHAPRVPDWHWSFCFADFVCFYPVHDVQHCIDGIVGYGMISLHEFLTLLTFDCCSKIRQESSWWFFAAFRCDGCRKGGSSCVEGSGAGGV